MANMVPIPADDQLNWYRQQYIYVSKTRKDWHPKWKMPKGLASRRSLDFQSFWRLCHIVVVKGRPKRTKKNSKTKKVFGKHREVVTVFRRIGFGSKPLFISSMRPGLKAHPFNHLAWFDKSSLYKYPTLFLYSGIVAQIEESAIVLHKRILRDMLGWQ